MQNLLRLIGRFRKDRRGNIAVIFAIACIPLISAVGCAVDYSMATRMKAKLQSAADGAAVASISQRSLGYVAAGAMTSDGSVGPGVTDANNIFDGNMSNATGYQNLVRTSTVTKTGLRLTANITYTADVPTTFMRVVGFQKLSLSGSSSASALLPAYLDFYLALDVSSSMGLPSTTAEAVRMQAINPDNYKQYPTGCTLACHFAAQNSACTDSGTQRYKTNNYCMGFAFSRLGQTALANLINLASTASLPKQNPGLPDAMRPNLNANVTPGAPNSLVTGNVNSLPYSLTAATSCPTDGTDNCIQLRLDAVGYALNDPTNGMFALARRKTIVTNQFRIGLYPFITDIDPNYSPLTATISAGSAIDTAAQNLATQLDTNANSALGSGGTHIDNALHSLNALIAGGSGAVGDGSSTTNTLPYVFLVTDGAQDNQYKDVPNGSWHGSNHATVLNDASVTYRTICTTLKNRGIIVSVLNIPYQTIDPVNHSFSGDEDTYANTNIQYIEPSLQACASPADAGGSYYYKATSPQQIKDSLNAMFNHSLQTAHITN
jgi:Flp pilus assembly protein TadG